MEKLEALYLAVDNRLIDFINILILKNTNTYNPTKKRF